MRDGASMVKVYAVKLDMKFEKNKSEKLTMFISKARRKSINNFYKYINKIQSIFGEILIRKIIQDNFKINNKSISFYKNDYGKPVLINNSKFHFNISHSGEWVVCVVNDSPVGIDIEKIQLIDYSVTDFILSEKEYKNFTQISDENKLSYFYYLWTLKESYIKAEGKGLSIPLNEFTIECDLQMIPILLGDKLNKTIFKNYNIDPNYVLSVCASENNFDKNVKIYNIEELYDEVLSQWDFL